MDENEWVYPDHESLERTCGLFDMNTYIKRRRGTLREYFEKFRPDLLREAEVEAKHSKDANKLLWWEQDWIDKAKMEDYKNSWFK